MLIIGVTILVLGGVGWSAFSNNQGVKGDAMMEKTDDAMMQKEDAAMMEKKSEGAMMEKKSDAMMDTGETMMKVGSYESYSAEKIAKAATGDVVLFFRASWCPTCRTVDADIRANLKNIPFDLTILDVDYDNSTSLKQKYGVTYQHTFVQVDAQGTLIKKWSGSPTLSALVAEVK